MKRSLMAVMVPMFLLLSVSAEAARKPCDELKQEIAAKLDAKGVQSYVLDVTALDTEVTGKVVGTCDGGSQQIVYTRNPVAVDATSVTKVD